MLSLCCMQFLRRYIVLTLALLITLSATGINVSVHRCCGKIKNFTLLGDNKVCSKAARPVLLSCSLKQHNVQLEPQGRKCCSDQKINVSNELEASLQKNQISEKHVQPFLFSISFFKSFFSLDELPAVKLRPFIEKHFKEPLIVLLQQFRI
ncbi:HYC_CC_PP family protein [Arcticibacter tournemirensis]|uniref:Uncharacterized protein n=2 Tax=Arcticibacter tournemirensis TaxID=699437 RepID=A0A4Q0M3I7_9SPHI|nr:hypothetical protein EKH83_19155 [Arcticibacter tournemirensis]